MSSKFEFLGNTTLTQYLPRQSFIHSRDPRARLLAYLSIIIAVIFVNNFLGLGFGLLFAFIFYIIANIPIKYSTKGIKQALPFLIILALLQIVFSKGHDFADISLKILGFAISYQALNNAGILILRFIVLIMLLNGFAMTVSTSQATAALFYLLKPLEKVRFPVNDLTMVVQIAMRFLPLVAQNAEKIAKAQAARGGDWGESGLNPIRQAKLVLPLLVPIMVNSLKQAETMALAIESRGFNAAEERSSFYALKFDWKDTLFLGCIVLVSIGILILNSAY